MWGWKVKHLKLKKKSHRSVGIGKKKRRKIKLITDFKQKRKVKGWSKDKEQMKILHFGHQYPFVKCFWQEKASSCHTELYSQCLIPTINWKLPLMNAVKGFGKTLQHIAKAGNLPFTYHGLHRVLKRKCATRIKQIQAQALVANQVKWKLEPLVIHMPCHYVQAYFRGLLILPFLTSILLGLLFYSKYTLAKNFPEKKLRSYKS